MVSQLFFSRTNTSRLFPALEGLDCTSRIPSDLTNGVSFLNP